MTLITGVISDRSRRCLEIVPVQFLCRITVCQSQKIDPMCDRKKLSAFISDSNYDMHVLIMLIIDHLGL